MHPLLIRGMGAVAEDPGSLYRNPAKPNEGLVWRLQVRPVREA